MSRIKNLFFKMLTAIFAAVALICLVFLADKRYDDLKGEREYQRLRIYAEVTKNGAEQTDEETYPFPIVDEQGLRRINPDYYAWLRIPQTEIDYPVVLPENNQEYLKVTFEGEKRACGTLFFESSLTPFISFNTIIYGHNMKSGAMFGGLKDYLSERYGTEHNELYVCVQDEWSCYQVFSVYLTKNADITPYQSQFASREDVWKFIQECQNRSLYYIGNIEGAKEILTLSTCHGSNEKLIIQGYRKG